MFTSRSNLLVGGGTLALIAALLIFGDSKDQGSPPSRPTIDRRGLLDCQRLADKGFGRCAVGIASTGGYIMGRALYCGVDETRMRWTADRLKERAAGYASNEPESRFAIETIGLTMAAAVTGMRNGQDRSDCADAEPSLRRLENALGPR